MVLIVFFLACTDEKIPVSNESENRSIDNQYMYNGLAQSKWFEWDCDNLENIPLIRDLANILCDLTQNTLNFNANDDPVGYISNINLITNEELTFRGSEVNIKLKLKWYN